MIHLRRKIWKKYRTTEPLEIAESLGLEILYVETEQLSKLGDKITNSTVVVDSSLNEREATQLIAKKIREYLIQNPNALD